MSKVRVYEIAKELGVDNRDLVGKIAALGIQVRNHMSVVESVDADRIKRAYEKEKADNVIEERIRPTVLRRRAVVRPAKPEAAAPTNGHSVAAVSPEPTIKVDKAVDEAPAPKIQELPTTSMQDTLAASSAQAESTEPATPAPSRRGSVVRQDSEEPAPAPPRSKGVRPSQPPPAAVRLAHANLPPGVVARGNAVAPSAPPLTPETVSRIVSEHTSVRTMPSTTETPRRRELGRAALGPTGRQLQTRPGRRKAAPAGKKIQKTEITTPSAQKRVIRIEDQVNLQTLAQRMSLKASDVLTKLIQLGMTSVNINSTLDADTAKILASEFGYEVENVARTEEDLITSARGTFRDEEVDRIGRPPVVTVMGHVDHGKTSLLDKIRSANVASGEAGGITQHLGAYRVETNKGTVVFIDTPGHEAFTAMRARGAQVTDVVILVVAADDGVMPQTREAINHAKAAGVPIVVAVNKIDKPDARPEVIQRDLANEGLQPEDWGGDTMFVNVSAKTGEGIDRLLEGVLLQAEVLELKANPKTPAQGAVLEAYLDKGRGPVANVLVHDGTLRTGDFLIAGNAWGKIRAMTDDRGKQTTDAGPATPVEVLGLSDVPSAGESFYVVTDQKKAQEIAQARKQHAARAAASSTTRVGLDQIYQMMQSGEVQELKLVIKADAQGSAEALVKALTDLSTDKVRVNVIHTGVGGITENDVLLATASSAIIIGFHVRPAGNAASIAKAENVDIRLYQIIYEAVDEVKKAMAGLLSPTMVEKQVGKAEVRQIFTIPKIGTVAGCYVTDGKLLRAAKVRLIRDSVQVWEGNIRALRRFKDDVREVASGYECGLSLEGFNDIKEKDVIECFETEQVAATL